MNNRINGSVADIVYTIKKHSIFYKNIRTYLAEGYLGLCYGGDVINSPTKLLSSSLLRLFGNTAIIYRR